MMSAQGVGHSLRGLGMANHQQFSPNGHLPASGHFAPASGRLRKVGAEEVSEGMFTFPGDRNTLGFSFAEHFLSSFSVIVCVCVS